MTTSGERIINVWRCLHPAERNAARYMATTPVSPGYRTLGNLSARFINNLPYDEFVKRRDAWLYSWDLQVSFIEIDDVTVAVVYPDASWIADVATCAAAGNCPAAVVKCDRLTGYGTP